MDIFIGVVILIVIWSYISTWFDDSKQESQQPILPSIKKNDSSNINKTLKEEIAPIKPIINNSWCEANQSKRAVTNSNYTKNTTYVQQNNHKLSNDELKDHSKSVWEGMGYSVKSKERYAYKMYGKEIFTPNQVQKTRSKRKIKDVYNENNSGPYETYYQDKDSGGWN